MTEYTRHGLSESANHLFVAILEIVSRDTSTTLSLLTAALSEISLGSMDDSQEQERLASWQSLIRSYQADLPLMKDSMHEFVGWCFSDNVPPYVRNKVDDLARQIDDLITRVEKAHKALRAELSILESKRGIAEAEGVAKLTELAFIFIPLTFSASLFSMQVRELQESMPTLTGFVGVCFLFLCLSYGVRLAVRSRVIIDRKRELFRRIRVDYALDSKDVPAHVFIGWAFKQFSPAHLVEKGQVAWLSFKQLSPTRLQEIGQVSRLSLMLLFVSVIFASVLALVWTKASISIGLKALLTIILVGLAVVVGLYTMYNRFYGVFLGRLLQIWLSTSAGRARSESGESMAVEAV